MSSGGKGKGKDSSFRFYEGFFLSTQVQLLFLFLIGSEVGESLGSVRGKGVGVVRERYR